MVVSGWGCRTRLRVKQLRLDYEWGNIQCVAAAVIIIYGSL